MTVLLVTAENRQDFDWLYWTIELYYMENTAVGCRMRPGQTENF